MRQAGTAVVIVLALFALSAPLAYGAAGHKATGQGYPSSTNVPGVSGAGVVGANTSAGVAHAGGSLPFTGFQLGVVVLVGVLLIGGGLLLRASGRNRSIDIR